MKYSHRQIQRSIIYTQKHQKGGGKKNNHHRTLCLKENYQIQTSTSLKKSI